MTEQWRPITGIDASYSVSSYGRVRNDASGFILSAARKNKQGYVMYRFLVDGKYRDLYGHRLVAGAFLEKTGPVVRHLDGNKSNNKVENLAYGTQSDNMNDHYRLVQQARDRAAEAAA